MFLRNMFYILGMIFVVFGVWFSVSGFIEGDLSENYFFENDLYEALFTLAFCLMSAEICLLRGKKAECKYGMKLPDDY